MKLACIAWVHLDRVMQKMFLSRDLYFEQLRIMANSPDRNGSLFSQYVRVLEAFSARRDTVTHRSLMDLSS